VTHAALTKALKRPPGVPESECEGELSLTERFIDSAQTNEGAIGSEIKVWMHWCGKCGDTLVQRGGWLANTIPHEDDLPTPFGLLPPEERRRIFAEQDARIA